MRHPVALAGLLASLVAVPSIAAADTNDLALNRLSYYENSGRGMPPYDFRFAGGCGTSDTGFATCQPDNHLFANLVNELGGVFAPPLLAPSRSLGFNGLYFGYENSVTGINSSASAEYWRRGTVGNAPTDTMGNGTSRFRSTIPDQLFVSHFHIRKGFPYGFELGLHANWLHDSSMVTLGLDIRWALFEGFHSGIGYLPDLSVRGSVSTMVGNSQLYLTIVGVDAMIGKPVPIAGVVTITPYAGAQGLIIFGDSTVIDLSPTRSAYQECTRRQPDYANGSLGCLSGSGAPMVGENDSHNEQVFTAMRILRVRGAAGLRFRFNMFTFSGEFMYDLLEPQRLANNSDGTNPWAGQGRPDANGNRADLSMEYPHQWQVTFGAGLQF